MKTKLSYDIAQALAQTVVIDLAPACERIEIAGSIRRKKPEVGDIEIVAIPLFVNVADLLGFLQPVNALSALVHTKGKQRGWTFAKDGDRYKQFAIGPCNVDLFITTPEKWGCIFLIRTGSADFSHRLMIKKQQGGMMPAWARIADGRLWNGERALSTPEEIDVFAALGLDWIPPEERIC